MRDGYRRRALVGARARFLFILGVPALACGTTERPIERPQPVTNIPPPEPPSEASDDGSTPAPSIASSSEARRCGADQLREIACSESGGQACAGDQAHDAKTYIQRIEVHGSTTSFQHDPVLTRDVQALNPNRPLCCFVRCTNLDVAGAAEPLVPGGASRVGERCFSMPDSPSRVPSAKNDYCPSALKFDGARDHRRLTAVRSSVESKDRRPESWRSDRCCYENEAYFMGVGRPLRRGEERCLPDDPHLDGADAVVEYWHGMARGEHASVAAFEELAEELRACAAPPELIGAARVAAREEARHAELCYAELSQMVGRPLAPGPLPPAAAPAGDLKRLALATLRDGCFEETLGALLAAELAREMPAGTKRSALEVIARDELSHAELAFRILAACVQRDSTLRPALRAALAELSQSAPAAQAAADDSLELEGVPSRRRVRALARAVIAQVVTPCVEALLGAEPASEARVVV